MNAFDSAVGSMNNLWRAMQNRAAQALIALAATPTFNNIQSRWQSLSGDGQRLIQWTAALLLMALVWAYLWLPATSQREALVVRMPVLQNQLATMRTRAEEIKRIEAMPAVLTANARTLADTAGLQVAFGTNANVTIDENRQFRVTINNTAYTNWLDNLELALNRYRVRVVSVMINPVSIKPLSLDNAGNNMPVNIMLILADDAAGK